MDHTARPGDRRRRERSADAPDHESDDADDGKAQYRTASHGPTLHATAAEHTPDYSPALVFSL
jgi:hypothetical protein